LSVEITDSQAALSVVGVAAGAHRGDQAGLPEGAAEGERGVLRSSVGVVDEPGGRAPSRDGHREGVDDQVGLEIVTHRPADDLPRVHIHDHAEEEPALERRHVG
jgi:hypothetical protein